MFQYIIILSLFENLYFKVFWQEIAQLFGFLRLAFCFPMLRSLYSMIISFLELSRQCRELSVGKQRAEH